MDQSSFLFATPSFMEGVGRLIDFGDSLTEYNRVGSPEQADAWSIYLDWRAVGWDLVNAITTASSEETLPAAS